MQLANIQQKSDSTFAGLCQTFAIFASNSNGMFEDFRLKIFLTVVEAKSFTKAASILGITQPSVSQNIAELEKQLGTRLFDRLRSEVVLLPAGCLFKDYAESILKSYREASAVLAKLPECTVRVAASDEVFDYLTGTILSDFITLHDEILFEKTVESDCDLKVSLKPDDTKRGMLALCYHPSSEFARTRVWSVLSDFLKPTL